MMLPPSSPAVMTPNPTHVQCLFFALTATMMFRTDLYMTMTMSCTPPHI